MSENLDQQPAKRTVLEVEDAIAMLPALRGHEKLVKKVFHWLQIDRVNEVHSRGFDTPGPDFVKYLLDDFDITLDIENEKVLDNLPEGAFITISNHPFGALDGIMLIHLIGSRRPEYKVMVNMILWHLSAMRPNFIAVDQSASSDPDKKAVSMKGIREAIAQVRKGQPIGFFPAGAMSKMDWKWQLQDVQWRESVIRLIKQLKVPVIPIFFHGHNSFLFDLFGVLSWQLRTMRLPSEVFRKNGTTLKISIGDPISVEEQLAHQGSLEEFGKFLRERTYALRDKKK